MDATVKELYYHNNPSVYPLTAFPLIMRNAIESLHKDCGVPMGMVGSVMLASASLACQSLIDVVLPYDQEDKGSCALYLLILAESGGRKSTIFSKIMQPFNQYSSFMKEDYKKKVKKYEEDLEEWTENNKYLRSDLREAQSSKEREVIQEEIKKHREDKPVVPRIFHLLYRKPSEATLRRGLMEYPYGGVITAEAITFFQGKLADLLGELNEIWDGAPIPYTIAAKKIDIDIKAWMTCLLMVQPHIFDRFMSKNKNEARDSGFISRFLISSYPRNKDGDTNLDYSESNATLGEYNKRISELLKVQEEKFNSNDDSKISLHLSEKAKVLWQAKNTEINKKKDEGQEWENIHDIASKASNNALRIAAIFTRVLDDESTEISVTALENAYRIVEWHLRQAHQLFFKDSPQEIFIQDVYAVFKWIKDKFETTNNLPILKTEITQKGIDGPRKLRRVKQLDPILQQLVSLRRIVVIKCENRAVYIVKPRLDSYFDIYKQNIEHNLYIPFSLIPFDSICGLYTSNNTPGKYSNELFNPMHLQY
ncbi:TPA: DUF3987 domain-containing protein [Serratia fonticola]